MQIHRAIEIIGTKVPRLPGRDSAWYIDKELDSRFRGNDRIEAGVKYYSLK